MTGHGRMMGQQVWRGERIGDRHRTHGQERMREKREMELLRSCPGCGASTYGTQLCEICFLNRWAVIKQHARDHPPTCTRCGAAWPADLDQVMTDCPWGWCQEHYCQDCGRYQGGMGAADCPCDPERGHGTRGEAPRPSCPYKRSQRRRHRRR
jgi:hypothetical protein